MDRVLATVALAASMILAMLHGSPASADELIPYQSEGWRRLEVDTNHPDPGVAFAAPDFDDSAWELRRAAFAGNTVECDLGHTVHTKWNRSRDTLLLRHRFAAVPGAPCTLAILIDNDAEVWVNGTHVASITDNGCPLPLAPNVVIVPGNLILESNTLAVRATDRGLFKYFDALVTGPMVTPALRGSWGSVKILYR